LRGRQGPALGPLNHASRREAEQRGHARRVEHHRRPVARGTALEAARGVQYLGKQHEVPGRLRKTPGRLRTQWAARSMSACSSSGWNHVVRVRAPWPDPSRRDGRGSAAGSGRRGRRAATRASDGGSSRASGAVRPGLRREKEVRPVAGHPRTDAELGVAVLSFNGETGPQETKRDARLPKGDRGPRSAEAERQAIRLALQATQWNKSAAARLLRVDYKTLRLKMKHYGTRPGSSGCPDLWRPRHGLGAIFCGYARLLDSRISPASGWTVVHPDALRTAVSLARTATCLACRRSYRSLVLRPLP